MILDSDSDLDSNLTYFFCTQEECLTNKWQKHLYRTPTNHSQEPFSSSVLSMGQRQRIYIQRVPPQICIQMGRNIYAAK